jgi:hypothetical protein
MIIKATENIVVNIRGENLTCFCPYLLWGHAFSLAIPCRTSYYLTEERWRIGYFYCLCGKNLQYFLIQPVIFLVRWLNLFLYNITIQQKVIRYIITWNFIEKCRTIMPWSGQLTGCQKMAILICFLFTHEQKELHFVDNNSNFGKESPLALVRTEQWRCSVASLGLAFCRRSTAWCWCHSTEASLMFRFVLGSARRSGWMHSSTGLRSAASDLLYCPMP